jgi:hypothetical protein
MRLLENDTTTNLFPVVNHLTHLNIPKASVCSTTISTFQTTVVLSAAAEVQVEEATAILNAISPQFSVKPTKYGGRGCFANSDLVQLLFDLLRKKFADVVLHFYTVKH